MATSTFTYSVYASTSPLVGAMACVIDRTADFGKAMDEYISLVNSGAHTVVMYDNNLISDTNPTGIKFINKKV